MFWEQLIARVRLAGWGLVRLAGRKEGFGLRRGGVVAKGARSHLFHPRDSRKRQAPFIDPR